MQTGKTITIKVNIVRLKVENNQKPVGLQRVPLVIMSCQLKSCKSLSCTTVSFRKTQKMKPWNAICIHCLASSLIKDASNFFPIIKEGHLSKNTPEITIFLSGIVSHKIFFFHAS